MFYNPERWLWIFPILRLGREGVCYFRQQKVFEEITNMTPLENLTMLVWLETQVGRGQGAWETRFQIGKKNITERFAEPKLSSVYLPILPFLLFYAGAIFIHSCSFFWLEVELSPGFISVLYSVLSYVFFPEKDQRMWSPFQNFAVGILIPSILPYLPLSLSSQCPQVAQLLFASRRGGEIGKNDLG